ncbi:MAG: YqjF family protein, partial [Verrucomicrobiaceae bacterium]
LELNVRTYVHDEQGNSGVWFYSLDCNQPLAVEIARRLFHLPYQHAEMKAKMEGDAVRYDCQRKGETVAADYRYRPGGELRTAEPGSFEFFLLERYLLFSTSRDGRIHSGQVHHVPYTFVEAECDAWSAEPIRQAGCALPEGSPTSLLYSPGVDVSVYPLR